MIAESDKMMWLGPTPEMLNDPLFEAIWQTIKTWDVNVPEAYSGYCGANGNHVRAIFEAARRLSAPATHPNSAVVRFADEGTEHPWLRLRDVAYTREQATTLYNRARDGEPLTKDELYVAAAHAVHPLNGPLSLTPFAVGCLLQAYALKASAPAPAAPRVGDDGLPIWLPGGFGDRLSTAAEAFLAQYVYSPDEGSDHDPSEFERIMLEDFLGGMWAEESVNNILQEMARQALSAPPAASADDVLAGAIEVLHMLLRGETEAAMEAAGEAVTFLEDFAAGYRKLAPAQSVGQSAAQGVGDDVTEGELDKLLAMADGDAGWLLQRLCITRKGLGHHKRAASAFEKAAMEFADLAAGYRSGKYDDRIGKSAASERAIAYDACAMHCRLSALPKGQEHEG